MPVLNQLSSALTRQQAVHLLQRLSVGYTRSQVDALVGLTASVAVSQLLTFTNPNPPLPIDQATGATWVLLGKQTDNSNAAALRRTTRIWWMDLMMQDASALEKIVLFMHSHFTTKDSAVGRTEGIYHQSQLFRQYAKGNFKTLAHKICRDNAMLSFLSGFSNTKNSPNENFAREFLELYTIGKGPQIADGNYTTYTEDDVREAARVLTGYKLDTTYASTDPDTGLLRAYIKVSVHDTADKTFSSAFQNTVITGGTDEATIETELSALVDMIFNQLDTAKNIVRELYQFFVYPNITATIETNVITPLAGELFNNGYELEPILVDLFGSEHFFDLDSYDGATDNHIGGMISSPIQLCMHTAKYFNVAFPDPVTLYADFLNDYRFFEQHPAQLGMQLYDPTETAGWPAYHQSPAFDRSWISENSIVLRYVFGEKIVKGKKINGGNMNPKIDIVAWLGDTSNISDPYDPNIVIEDITNYVFPHGVSTDRRNAYKAFLVDPSEPDYYWGLEWSEYGVSGDDMVVRTRLELMLIAILQSPEYHVH